MNRTPSIEVRRELRREVGFGCPLDGCGNPYLVWHHFDPPWNEKPHHDPVGMIALCQEHHAKADGGAFTKEQLRELKLGSSDPGNRVVGKFDWMRKDLLAVVGGNFYYENIVIMRFRNEPIIYFNRDDKGMLLLNINMLSTSNEPRVVIHNNDWISTGNPEDIESPPSGRILRVSYSNGDMMRVEFRDLVNAEDVVKRYPDARSDNWNVNFPITTVEVHMIVGNTDIKFSPTETTIGGLFMKNCFFSHNGTGIAFG